jgi:hypothetical protein
VALVRAEPVARNVGVLFTEIGTGGGDELVDRGVAFIVVADLFDRARIEKPLREVFTLGHVENRVAAHDRTVADLVLVVLVLPHHRLHKENRDAVLALLHAAAGLFGLLVGQKPGRRVRLDRHPQQDNVDPAVRAISHRIARNVEAWRCAPLCCVTNASGI